MSLCHFFLVGYVTCISWNRLLSCRTYWWWWCHGRFRSWQWWLTPTATRQHGLKLSVRTRMSLCHLFFWLVTSLAFPETEVLSKGKKDWAWKSWRHWSGSGDLGLVETSHCESLQFFCFVSSSSASFLGSSGSIDDRTPATAIGDHDNLEMDRRGEDTPCLEGQHAVFVFLSQKGWGKSV